MSRSTHWVQEYVLARCTTPDCRWYRRTDGIDKREGLRVVAAGKSHARKPGHGVVIERGQTQTWSDESAQRQEENPDASA